SRGYSSLTNRTSPVLIMVGSVIYVPSSLRACLRSAPVWLSSPRRAPRRSAPGSAGRRPARRRSPTPGRSRSASGSASRPPPRHVTHRLSQQPSAACDLPRLGQPAPLPLQLLQRPEPLLQQLADLLRGHAATTHASSSPG